MVIVEFVNSKYAELILSKKIVLSSKDFNKLSISSKLYVKKSFKILPIFFRRLYKIFPGHKSSIFLLLIQINSTGQCTNYWSEILACLWIEALNNSWVIGQPLAIALLKTILDFVGQVVDLPQYTVIHIAIGQGSSSIVRHLHVFTIMGVKTFGKK